MASKTAPAKPYSSQPHTFSPTYVHPAYRLLRTWAKRVKQLRLPGNYQSVLDYLVGVEATQNTNAPDPRPKSRRDLGRALNISPTTASAAVTKFLELNWILDDAQGIRIHLQRQDKGQAATAPCPEVGQGDNTEKPLGHKANQTKTTARPFNLKNPEGVKNPSDSMHRTPAPQAPASSAPGEPTRKENRKTYQLTEAELLAKGRVVELLKAGKASDQAVGAVLGKGRGTWKTWARVRQVLDAAWKVIELREGSARAIRDPHKYLTACALHRDLGTKALGTLKAYNRHRAKPTPVKPEEAHQVAPPQDRAAALELERIRAEANRQWEAEEQKRAQAQARAKAAATRAWKAIMATAAEIQAGLDPQKRSELERWRDTSTPGSWALGVFAAAGRESEFNARSKAFHELQRKADKTWQRPAGRAFALGTR